VSGSDNNPNNRSEIPQTNTNVTTTGLESKVEYLEAFNYELSLKLKQLMNDKNQLEEKVYEYELSQYKTSSSKLDSLQLERLLGKVEDME